MAIRSAITLNDNLRLVDPSGVAVWQHVALDCLLREFSEDEGWVLHSAADYAEGSTDFSYYSHRGWFRGLRINTTLIDSNPDNLYLTVIKYSRFGEGLVRTFAMGGLFIGLIGGTLARIFGGKESILIQWIPLLALCLMAVAFVLAYPFGWILRRFAMDGFRMRALSESLLTDLQSPDAIEDFANYVEQQIAAAPPPPGPAPLTDADVEPDDRQMSKDDLQRKYGYSKGTKMHRLIHGERTGE